MLNVNPQNYLSKTKKSIFLLGIGMVVFLFFQTSTTLAFSGQVTAEKENWKADENPSFKLEDENLAVGLWDQFKTLIASEENQKKISVRLVSPRNKETELQEGEDFTLSDSFSSQKVAINKKLLTTPGRYQVKITLQDRAKTTFTQDFTWGVLAINMNKSIYSPNEKAQMAMAVLDEKGAMVCDASLKLKITNEKLNINDELSTENGKIIVNAECQLKAFTLKPDYEAEYQLGEAGTYALELEAVTKNGTFSISDSVEVQKNVPFDVERTTATRIYPPEKYPVVFNILANGDFKGQIIETVPDSFEIEDANPNDKVQISNQIQNPNGQKSLIWDVDVRKGDKFSLGYQFKAPNISPEFYLLGPLQFKENNKIIFAEARQWQIAADAVGFIGSVQNIGSASGGDVTLDLSGLGLQPDDLVIVAYSIADADNVDMAMAEVGGTWQEVADLFSDDTYDANLGVYYKVMGASPDASVVLDGVGGSDTTVGAVAMAFRGVDPVNPMDVAATTVSGASGLNTMHANPPAINHNNPSGVWTVIAGSNTNGVQGAQTFTFPTGYTTDAVQQNSNDTVDGIVGMGYRSSGVSDPEDPGVMTASGTDGTDYAWAAVTMALRPLADNPPTLTISAPPAGNLAVAEGSNYNVTFSLGDTDDVVTGAFYYDINNDGAGGVAITGCGTKAEADTICVFDTSVLTSGIPYYVYGVTSDGTNPTVTTISAGTITVNEAPTLTISAPPAGDTDVVEGANYDVTFALSDPEEIVTAAFYYDINNDGTGGIAITGCGTKAEADTTCVFDTSVLTPGTPYYVYGVTTGDSVNGSVTTVSSGTVTSNDIPILTISAPPAGDTDVAEGSNYDVTFSLTDVDDVVTAAFYYDINNDGTGGIAITGCGAKAEADTICVFDTSVLTSGIPYYVYGVTSGDSVNGAVTTVSAGTITVNEAPTLTISAPPSGNLAVAEGANYDVTFALSDPEEIVTAAFYYDINNDGAGGVAITGCGTKAEADTICVFDTSVLTSGIPYYVYGVTSDGTNPTVTTISAGTITVNEAPTGHRSNFEGTFKFEGSATFN